MKNKIYIYLFLFLTALYVVISLLAPTDPTVLHKYNIDQARAHLLILTIAIPSIFIWLSALYGLTRFRNYAEVVADTPEGEGFQSFAKGLTVLAFSLPINAVVSSTLGYWVLRRPSILTEATIIKNYTNIILYGIGFLLISQGSIAMIKLLKRNSQTIRPRGSLLGMVVLSSVYTWLITTSSIGGSANTIYSLPDWLILATIAIPYVYIWSKGILAVYQLFLYKRRIRGAVYISALDLFAKGLATIILLSIFTQLLVTISARLNRLNLTPILLIVYLLVALNALGYGLVARGAKKLKLIEEV